MQDLISLFTHVCIVFGVRRYSKAFKSSHKNVVILNIRISHSQERTMQKVFQKTWQDTSKIDQHLIENGAQMVPDAIWKDLEGSGGQNGSSESISKSVWGRSALWTRLDAVGASRRGPGSPKWMQIRYKILLKRVSVTFSELVATVKYSNYILKMQ